MSDSTTLTSKGQVTIPQEIRQKLGLKAGDKIVFTHLVDGTVIVRPKILRPAEVASALYEEGQRRFPIEALRMGAADRVAARSRKPQNAK